MGVPDIFPSYRQKPDPMSVATGENASAIAA
jgi:hypothetical protein